MKIVSRNDKVIFSVYYSVFLATICLVCLHEKRGIKSIHSYILFVCISLFVAAHPPSCFIYTVDVISRGIKPQKQKTEY